MIDNNNNSGGGGLFGGNNHGALHGGDRVLPGHEARQEEEEGNEQGLEG